MKGRRRSEGFVLLEVLVGLALFTVGVVAVLVSLRTSLTVVQRSEDMLRASLLLEQVLLGWGAERGELETEGTEGGFDWRIEVEPWQVPPELAPFAESSAAPEAAEPEPPNAFDLVRVTVLWESRGRVRSVEAQELMQRMDPFREVLEQGGGEEGRGEKGEGEQDELGNAAAARDEASP